MTFDLIDFEVSISKFLVDGIEVFQNISVAVDDFFALVGELCFDIVFEIIYTVQDFSGLLQSFI